MILRKKKAIDLDDQGKQVYQLRAGYWGPSTLLPESASSIVAMSACLVAGTLASEVLLAPQNPFVSLAIGLGLAALTGIIWRFETLQNRRGCLGDESDLLIVEPWEIPILPNEQCLEEQQVQHPIIEALAGHDINGVRYHSERAGAVVQRIYVKFPRGAQTSKIANALPDIARDMGVKALDFDKNVGDGLAAFDLPLAKRRTIELRALLQSAEWEQAKNKMQLPVVIGEFIDGNVFIADLAKLVHLLVGGTTGGGKSALMNVMLLSLMQAKTTGELKLIMIDPKLVELTAYKDSPYLYSPVITDMTEAAGVLSAMVDEMEARYAQMSKAGVKNIAGYHAKGHKDMPYIVIVIDEFADMMMVVGEKVEELIVRLGQKARAAGIHLMLATQRPSVNVVTGLIKANIPTRIGLLTSSGMDSRTIIDQEGCQNLLGMGDMLFSDSAGVRRAHGGFVPDDEIEYWLSQPTT